LLEHPLPVPFWDSVRRRIQDGDDAERPFNARLDRWKETFKALDKGVAVADAVKLRQRIIVWCRALCGRIRLPLTRLTKLIERRLAGKAKRPSKKVN